MEVGGGLANIIGAARPHGMRTWSGQPADMVSDLRAGRPAKRYAYGVRRQVTGADTHGVGKATGRRHGWVNAVDAAGELEIAHRSANQGASMLAADEPHTGSTASSTGQHSRNPQSGTRHCHGTQGAAATVARWTSISQT